MPPVRQERHSVRAAPEHVAHEASQLAHEFALSSAYLPSGHVARHEPRSKYLVPVDGQAEQSDELLPVHCLHEEEHSRQSEVLPKTSANLPSSGHSLTQVPESSSVEGGQLKQSEEEAPLHVRQLSSHDLQTSELSAYLPSGVHEATHSPGALTKLAKG